MEHDESKFVGVCAWFGREKKMREGLWLREGIKDQSQMLLHRALDLQEIKKVEKVRQKVCLKWESRGSEAYNHPTRLGETAAHAKTTPQ